METTLEMVETPPMRVGVWGHWATVTHGNTVTIHHTKACSKPCDLTKKITEYLEAELFVEKGSYVVSETTK